MRLFGIFLVDRSWRRNVFPSFDESRDIEMLNRPRPLSMHRVVRTTSRLRTHRLPGAVMSLLEGDVVLGKEGVCNTHRSTGGTAICSIKCFARKNGTFLAFKAAIPKLVTSLERQHAFQRGCVCAGQGL